MALLTYFGETALFADFGETALFADFGETAFFADFGETTFFVVDFHFWMKQSFLHKHGEKNITIIS
jgi:hypothetical protein